MKRNMRKFLDSFFQEHSKLLSIAHHVIAVGSRIKRLLLEWRYMPAFAVASLLIIFVSVTYRIFGELHPVVAAAAGLLSAIPGKMLWQTFMSPVLIINRQPEPRLFHPDGSTTYQANRINIENKGRSAATNCKAYIVSTNGKGRVCWVVPKERPNATINPQDSEGLDLCAFYADQLPQNQFPQIIAPIEDGWKEPKKCRDLNSIAECEVLVTADNTAPVRAKVQLNLKEKTIRISIDRDAK